MSYRKEMASCDNFVKDSTCTKQHSLFELTRPACVVTGCGVRTAAIKTLDSTTEKLLLEKQATIVSDIFIWHDSL